LCSTPTRPTPGSFRKKSIYFVKLEEEKLKLDLDEMKTQLVVGDFAKTPLDQV